MAATDNLATLLARLCECRVQCGPFAGMHYDTEAIHSAHLPKLLGCYEQELHGCLERFLRKDYRCVVNIGCGEGYYAVGLALRLPRARVYAFDSEPRARELCRALAVANGVEKRVHVLEACTVEALQKALKPGTLVLCDCEGGEIELLRPDLLPVLDDCDLLVELHDNDGLNASGHIPPRFQFSHAMQVIPATMRTEGDFDRAIEPLLKANREEGAEPNGASRECPQDENGDPTEDSISPICVDLRHPYGTDVLRTLSPDQKRAALDEGRYPNMRWVCFASVPVPAIPKTPVRRSKEATSRLITGCILARNEAPQIEAAIESLRGVADEILVIDNESDDETAAIALRCGARVLLAPKGNGNFDGARNLAIEEASAEWIFYLDADERIPAPLAAVIRRMVVQSGDSFEALQAPFKTYFCGQWMRHCGWWPGYTRPQLLKKGAFRYGERLHSGVEVDGRIRLLPFETEEFAIDHFCYDDISHYLEKFNRYTTGEAENLLQDGLSHAWQGQMAHFLLDWQGYYDRSRGREDGMHGFILSFFAGIYRFLARAKLWDLRRQRGQTSEMESVPGSVMEGLEFWAQSLREGVAAPLRARHDPETVPVKDIPADWFTALKFAEPTPILPSEKRHGIAVCVFVREKDKRLEVELESLRGWADRIIVVELETTDGGAGIFDGTADHVLTAPPGLSLEAAPARMSEEIHALAFAEGEWLLTLDVGESVPPALGERMQRLVGEHGREFDALCLPLKSIYYGKWMESPAWWPGDYGPRLVKKGTFSYSEDLPSGLVSQGRVYKFPADDPSLALVKEPYKSLDDYLDALNRDTDDQARAMDLAGIRPTWQNMLGHFAEEWHVQYDRKQAYQDGMHGFVQSFMSAFYRFSSRAKLWDRRRQRGETDPNEPVTQLQRFQCIQNSTISARFCIENASPIVTFAARFSLNRRTRRKALHPSQYLSRSILSFKNLPKAYLRPRKELTRIIHVQIKSLALCLESRDQNRDHE